MKCVGRTVAKTTTVAVIAGRLPPLIPHNPVRYVDALHIAKDVARAVAVSRTGSFLSSLDSIFIETSANNFQIRKQSRQRLFYLACLREMAGKNNYHLPKKFQQEEREQSIIERSYIIQLNTMYAGLELNYI